MHSHLHQDTTNNLLHGGMHNQTNNNQQSNIGSLQNHPASQQLSWTCEICGRMFATRDEWSLHAKSHLEVCFYSNKLLFVMLMSFPYAPVLT